MRKRPALSSIRRKRTIPRFNPNDRKRPQKRVDPINENIRYPEVMVIGPDGTNLGKMPSRKANEIASSYGLDLFCVAPQANPPVCKILNYGKFRFEEQKAERLRRKNSKAAELKEIQLHISIGEHDLRTKAKKTCEFLADGDKVNVRVILKGREMAHKEIGEELFGKFKSVVEETTALNLEKAPSWEGKCYAGIFAPAKKKTN